MQNIPVVKLGLVAVSRDCFPIALSEKRRAAIAEKCGQKKLDIVEIKTTVENEKDMLKAVEELKANECNAAVVFLGNFGPETPETLIAKNFDGPCMFVAAAEGDGNMINIGFMVCQPEFIDYIDGDSTVLEKKPLETVAKLGQLMAYKHDGFWQCMDTEREKEMLEKLWASGQAPWKVWAD